MRRIALVAVNARYSHTNLALRYLLRALEDEAGGAAVTSLIEWNINLPQRDLLEKLAGEGFDLIAFSVYIWNSMYVRQLLPDLHRLDPAVLVVLGGPEAVHQSNMWLNLEGVDYILDGAAESCVSLLLSIDRGDQSRQIPVPARPFTETLFPYNEKRLDQLRGRLVYYETSRGCQFRCAYCLSARADQRPDSRRPEQVLQEIRQLVRFPGTVKFVDRSFNADKQVSRLIWSYLAEHPPAGRFHFELYPLLLDSEDFSLLEKLPAGAVQFEIGIQSTNPQVLKAVGRHGDWPREAEIISRLKELGLFDLHLDQIVGLPLDTPETAACSMNEILELEPQTFQLGFLKLLPGTPLAEQGVEFGLRASGTPPYELLASGTFPFTELQRFRRIAVLVELFYNRGYFRRTLQQVSRLAGGYYQFFLKIVEDDGIDLSCRRWEYWGERILSQAEGYSTESRAELIDRLRLDWCRRARGHYYPRFLAYRDDTTLRSLRRDYLPLIRDRYPQALAGEISKAILFVPESSLFPGVSGLLFFTTGGRSTEIQIPLK